MLTLMLCGTEFESFGGLLGTSWGYFGQHLAVIWGIFWGGLGWKRLCKEGGGAISPPSLLGPKSGPKASPRGLARHQNEAKRPPRDNEKGIRTQNLETLTNDNLLHNNVRFFKSGGLGKSQISGPKRVGKQEKIACKAQAWLCRGFGTHLGPRSARLHSSEPGMESSGRR